jgi:hypothetical protein
MDAKDMKDWHACRVCGAVVSNTTKHREWHESKGDEPAPEGSGRVWFF